MNGLLGRMLLTLAVATPWLTSAAPSAAEPPVVVVYRSPTCGCCGKWVEHLEAHGFSVEEHQVPDLVPLKREHGIPRSLSSCHTALVEGYVIEGHVPASDVTRLLAERPPVAGLAVPGMPIGSPGMEGPDPEAYRVFSFDGDGRTQVFSTHQPGPR